MLSSEWMMSMRELNEASMLFRLVLAFCMGGLVGIDQDKNNGNMGMRASILVCMGAALTMILSQYVVTLQAGLWADITDAVGNRTDASRMGAQVICGVGFLGAGLILRTDRKSVTGLSRAAGIWCCACLGIALGSGLYECAFSGLIIMLFCNQIVPWIEKSLVLRSRNMVIYVEYISVKDMKSIMQTMRDLNVDVQDVDADTNEISPGVFRFSAIMMLRLPPKMSHTQPVAELSKLENICQVDDI